MRRNSVSTYVHIAVTPPRLYTAAHILDGSFLKQKTYTDIQILYSLKYKHSKKYISLWKNKVA